MYKIEVRLRNGFLVSKKLTWIGEEFWGSPMREGVKTVF